MECIYGTVCRKKEKMVKTRIRRPSHIWNHQNFRPTYSSQLGGYSDIPFVTHFMQHLLSDNFCWNSSGNDCGSRMLAMNNRENEKTKHIQQHLCAGCENCFGQSDLLNWCESFRKAANQGQILATDTFKEKHSLDWLNPLEYMGRWWAIPAEWNRPPAGTEPRSIEDRSIIPPIQVEIEPTVHPIKFRHLYKKGYNMLHWTHKTDMRMNRFHRTVIQSISRISSSIYTLAELQIK